VFTRSIAITVTLRGWSWGIARLLNTSDVNGAGGIGVFFATLSSNEAISCYLPFSKISELFFGQGVNMVPGFVGNDYGHLNENRLCAECCATCLADMMHIGRLRQVAGVASRRVDTGFRTLRPRISCGKKDREEQAEQCRVAHDRTS
jgi:hypothetical protein